MKKRLNAFRCCPVCGSADFPQKGEMRECGNCGFCEFNNPIAAVAVWVLDPQDQLLLIERAKDPGKGKLAPPGGFVDAGESLEAAAVREVLEETGVALDELTYLCSAPNEYTYQGLTRPVCDAFFIARVSSVTVVAETSEVSAWQRIPFRELKPDALAFASMREAYRQLRRCLRSD